jgi:hypothetical protein
MWPQKSGKGAVQTLHDLQVSFSRFISGGSSDELIQSVLEDGLQPAARLAIYRNNVVARLTDALRETFPVICQLVDRRFFDYAAHTFIRRCLPSRACLAEYGEDFPAFLAEFPPAADLKYLPDIGRLEWSIGRVLQAAPMTSIEIGALIQNHSNPALIGLQLSPVVRFLASDFAIDQIWRAHQRSGDFTTLLLDSAGVHLQIAAMNGLHLTHLPASTWRFRSALCAGSTLGMAVSAALSSSPDFDVSGEVASLFEGELVVGLRWSAERVRSQDGSAELR